MPRKTIPKAVLTVVDTPDGVQCTVTFHPPLRPKSRAPASRSAVFITALLHYTKDAKYYCDHGKFPPRRKL